MSETLWVIVIGALVLWALRSFRHAALMCTDERELDRLRDEDATPTD